MNSNTPAPAIDTPGSLLDQLPIDHRSAAERSRAIRELVSFAMEGPIVPAPLTPMPIPVPVGEATVRHRSSTAALSPLPTTPAPIQACW